MSWLNSLLAFGRDDRFILGTMGLAAVGVVLMMTTILELVKESNEIPPQETKPQYITQDTEDALQLDTLEKLLAHPTYSIREVSIKILCDRAMNDPQTMRALLYGITRPDYDERMKCLRALALLTGQTSGFDGLAQLNVDEATSALVRSLELSLDDGDCPKLDDPSWDEYYLRDMAERFCLMFLLELIKKHGAETAVKAGIVRKWLARQNWGDKPEERLKNFKQYVDSKNNRIVELVIRVKRSRRGLKALSIAGLMEEENFRLHMQELQDEVMDTEVEYILGAVRRAREHSAEEQRLRRQHREAMVLNDGTRPLGRDDIIERDHGSPG